MLQVFVRTDGRPLEVGQTVWHVGNGVEFTVIGLPRSGEYQAVKLRLDDGAVTGLDPDQLTHQRPVLDADGVLCREGDTVYKLEDSRPYTVKRIDGDHVYINAGGKAFDIWTFPGKLTHEQPDTWERIEEDVTLSVEKYRERYGIKKHDCMTWPQLVRDDLVRRARKLAERGA